MAENYDHMMGTEQDVSNHETYQMGIDSEKDNLMSSMYSQRAQDERSGASGKHFWDGGANIPGVQKGKNDTYSKSLKDR